MGTLLEQPKLSFYNTIETRLNLSVDYVKIINFLHNSPIGVRVMCDSGNIRKTLSQFLINDDFHLIVNDLDNLPEVNREEGKLIKCVGFQETRTFTAPEQKWPYATKPFRFKLMPPYDEKTDIWKTPNVVNKLLGHVEGSSYVKSQLREVMDRCHKIDPQQRPAANEVLKELLRVQQLVAVKEHLAGEIVNLETQG